MPLAGLPHVSAGGLGAEFDAKLGQLCSTCYSNPSWTQPAQTVLHLAGVEAQGPIYTHKGPEDVGPPSLL